jgi:preprotein translocase subunit YajC
MSFLIPAAYADAAAPAAGPAGTGFEWIFLVGFLVIFYLMIWRPQAKRAKEQKNLLGNLQKGDEVVTNGGIAGKIVKVTDDFVVLEVSDTVELKFQTGAIAATLPKGTLTDICVTGFIFPGGARNAPRVLNGRRDAEQIPSVEIRTDLAGTGDRFYLFRSQPLPG